MSQIDYYYSSVSGSQDLKKKQQKIEMVLDSKKIPYTKHDIAADETLKTKMREVMKDPKGLPPQICNGDNYCGGYDAFEEALECEELEVFLKLK